MNPGTLSAQPPVNTSHPAAGFAPESPPVLSSTEWHRITACPCCGGTYLPTALHNVVKCRSCGVWFLNPRPPQDAIARLYDSDKTYQDWSGCEAARQHLWEQRIRLVRRFLTTGLLLDVGAGDGAFLQRASQDGWQVQGTEVSAAAILRGQKRNVVIRQGEFTSLPLSEGRYDLVTFWHVLEHVPFPQETIQCAYRSLKPGGLLIVAVPNRWHRLIQKASGRGEEMIRTDFRPGEEVHLTHFDPFSLKRLIRREGFSLLHFGLDDVDLKRSRSRRWKNLCLHAMSILGWHLGQAMVVVARRP